MTSPADVLLAVDDETDFLELVEQIAVGAGYEVFTAASAGELRDRIYECKPSIILLDLQLPGVDGVEILRELAARKVTAGIILASGMDTRVIASARQLAASLGLTVLASLQKPLMIEDIENLLEKHRQQSARFVEADLMRAIEEFELAVHYQPKLTRAHTGWQIHGVEALVRWQHPQLGMIYPGEFLPLAEKSGLITAVTDFVLTESLRQVGHWREHGIKLGVAVNLSPRLVRDLEFPDRLERILREYKVSAEQLTLEVTEAASLHDPELVTDIFTRLRVKGVGLALDDFGTGTSSLTQLYKMPFNELKIDGSLTCEVPFTRAAATVVRAIVDLGHSLSLSVCAEGVENEAAFDFLDKAGCDSLQGDAFSKAVPAFEIETLFKNWKPAAPLKAAP